MHVSRTHGDKSIFMEDRLCIMCEGEFTVRVSRADCTCSDSCERRRQYQIASYREGNSERIENPYTHHSNKWESRKGAVIEAAGSVCQGCGFSSEDHEKRYGRDLHVHHIQPVHKFKDGWGRVDFESAEAEENLVPLCHQCHGKWEGIPVRPQVITA